MRKFPENVAEQLKALEGMQGPELRGLWRAAFGRPPPNWVQREFLRSALAYHFQAKAYGGLSPATDRRLKAYADDLQSGSRTQKSTALRTKPGTRFVREWGGETHVVTALDADFDYRGTRYGSLSEIARVITKTRWSGPAFFGLKNARSSNAGDGGGNRA